MWLVVGRHGLGCVDHENGKLKDELRVVCLLGVFAVELEGAVVGEEGGLFPWSEMGWY